MTGPPPGPPARPGPPVATERFEQIRTERLLLRRWCPADRRPFAAMNADSEVMRYFPTPLTRAQSDALVDRIERRFEEFGYGLWALEADGELLGFTGLAPMHRCVAPGGLEVAWRLARSAWGRGYATEAGRAALRVAFGPLGLAEIWSWTAVANTPSQAVMRRIGLTRHAEIDHPDLPVGHALRRHVLYRGHPAAQPPADDRAVRHRGPS